jgi:hypothetical protein
MIRNALFASFIVLGAAGDGARAGDAGPWLVNTGGDLEVAHGSPSANLVGGAHVTIAGGGDNLSYEVALGGRTQTPGPIATLTGGGEEARLAYAPAASAPMFLVGVPQPRRQ